MTDTQIVTTIRREFTATAEERALVGSISDRRLVLLYRYWISHGKETTFKALIVDLDEEWYNSP